MDLTLSQETKLLLSKIKGAGIREINIFKFHDYVTVVTFVLMNGELVSVRAIDECVAPRFEVFLISASNELIKRKPDITLRKSQYGNVRNIFIVSKCNWSVPVSDSEKIILKGDKVGATTQFEGQKSEVPGDAISSATFDAGVRVQFSNLSYFFVVSSINPFDLSVSHEESFSKVDESKYEFKLLC